MTDAADQLLTTLAIRGMVRGTIPVEADELIEAELALNRAGVLVATRAGHDRAVEMLRLVPGSEDEAALRSLYERFLLQNRSLREICVAWQTRPDGTANDHSDPAYDARVRDDLEDVHDQSLPLVRRMAAVAASLGAYSEGLDAALAAIDAGDVTMLTAPLAPSYHTVWMWWHQEQLLRLGIDRAEDERLEEQLVTGQHA